MKHVGRIRLFVVALAALIVLLSSKPTVSVSRLADARARIEAAGYRCTMDSVQQHAENGFLVSREQVSREEACSLCKVGPMGPQWKGKVWVAPMGPDFPLETLPEGAAALHWGHFVLFGDGDLMQEIEDKL